jgi:hypothetical protein
MSVDPENAGASSGDAQSWNGYAYARNSPMVYIDPTGLAYNFYRDGQWYQVQDATQFEQYGYTVYGGNTDGSILYIRDGKGNQFTATFENVPVNNDVQINDQSGMSSLMRGVGSELERSKEGSLKLIGAFAAVTYGSGAIIGGIASVAGGATLTQLGIRYGTEAWRVIRATRPLAKMGHAAKHYKDFLKYANLTREEVALILEYVRRTGTQTGTGANGEKIIEKVVQIGSSQVNVRVLETISRNIKTGYPFP